MKQLITLSLVLLMALVPITFSQQRTQIQYPIFPNGNSATFLNGTLQWSTPAGGGGSTNGANWTGSGTTNSTLPGVASAYGFVATNSITLAGSTITSWPTGGTNWVDASANNFRVTNSFDVPGTATIGTATFTNFTTTHLTVSDISSSNKLVATAPTSTTFTNGYFAAWTNTAGIFNGNAAQGVSGAGTMVSFAPTASPTFTGTVTIPAATVTGNVEVSLTAGNTNIVNFALTSNASVTNYVSQNTSFAYATNAADNVERTVVHWLRNTAGSDKTFAIPSTWITNKLAGPPSNLTNNIWTKMILTSLGNTSSSANQTNVLVSFEYY